MAFGYKAFIISTIIVDYDRLDLHFAGYKAFIISTIVDMENVNEEEIGYKAFIISAIVGLDKYCNLKYTENEIND